MATNNLHHRIRDVSNVNNTAQNDDVDEYDDENNDDYDNNHNNHYDMGEIVGGRIQTWKEAIARRGIMSFIMAVVVPASVHVVDIFFIRSDEKTPAAPSAGMEFVPSLAISLSSWFAWVEHEFDWRLTTVVALYGGYIASTVAWDPIVFGFGAMKLGVLVSIARLFIVLGISLMLSELNRTGAQLVLTMCAAPILIFWIFIN